MVRSQRPLSGFKRYIRIPNSDEHLSRFQSIVSRKRHEKRSREGALEIARGWTRWPLQHSTPKPNERVKHIRILSSVSRILAAHVCSKATIEVSSSILLKGPLVEFHGASKSHIPSKVIGKVGRRTQKQNGPIPTDAVLENIPLTVGHELACERPLCTPIQNGLSHPKTGDPGRGEIV